MMDTMLLLRLICYLTIFEVFRFLGFGHSPVNSPSWGSEQHREQDGELNNRFPCAFIKNNTLLEQ